jgi:pyruvate/2-oxoglutarate dehydrogenase complex dihydrolipoamide dehydrogenase (E3) component
MSVEHVENLVIGSGEGGKLIAWKLARAGQSTIVVERAMIGGACPNVACLPSKNVIHSAKAAALADPRTGLGVLQGNLQVDMPAVARRKRQMVDELRQIHLENFRSSGAELVLGTARFTEPRTFEVALNDGGTRLLRGERVFLNVGSRARVPDVPGLAAAQPLTHVEVLDLERLPEHLAIVGGGYVGLEFAQALRRLGSQVTVVQRGPRLLDREDPDVTEAMLELIRDAGIQVLLDTDLVHVEGLSGAGVKLRVRGPHAASLEASDILVATGRTPNTDRLDAAKGGVRLDARGYVEVNPRLETSASSVWAMGDCAGSPQFTHAGHDDFRIVLANLSGGNRTTTGRLMPYCLFTDPELAHVGLTENEARARGIPHRVARQPMARVLRTHTLSEKRGFMKALIGDDDRILGFTMLGAEASEPLAAVQTAMIGNLPYTALRDAIFTHPTMSEGLNGLFEGVLERAG